MYKTEYLALKYILKVSTSKLIKYTTLKQTNPNIKSVLFINAKHQQKI